MRGWSHRKPLSSTCRKLRSQRSALPVAVTASPISPTLGHGKQPFIVLVHSAGQESGRRTAGTAWPCFMKSGLRGRVRGRGLGPPEAHSLPRLVADAGCGPRPKPRMPAGASLSHLASSQYGGWVSKVSVPRESPWKMYHLLGPSLGKHTVRHLDGILFLGKECQHSTEGRTCGNGYVLVRSLKNTTCHKYLGTEMMARKIPTTGPRRLQGGLPCT